MENNSLQHHGVKGMKWGIRRANKSYGGKRKNNAPRMSADAKEAARLKKKKVSEMSTEELKKLNKRMEAEQNYKRLNPSKVKKGIAIAGTVAAGLGTVALLYNNSKTVIGIGKKIGNGIVKSSGDMIMSDLNKGLSSIYID